MRVPTEMTEMLVQDVLPLLALAPWIVNLVWIGLTVFRP